MYDAKLIFRNNLTRNVTRYKMIGYNVDILQQTACMVVNQIMADNFTFLFDCMKQKEILQHEYSAANCKHGC